MKHLVPLPCLYLSAWRYIRFICLKQACIVSIAFLLSFPSLMAKDNATGLTNVNGTLFFAANTPDKGTELWKSNGAPSSTFFVKNIAPLEWSSTPAKLTKVG